MNYIIGMQGITLVTFAAMLCGILVHILKQVMSAKRNGVKITPRAYVMENPAETILSAVCGFIGYLALPEVGSLAPDIAKLIGLADKQTVLASFVAGYIGNSFADFIGGRLQTLTGTKPNP